MSKFTTRSFYSYKLRSHFNWGRCMPTEYTFSQYFTDVFGSFTRVSAYKAYNQNLVEDVQSLLAKVTPIFHCKLTVTWLPPFLVTRRERKWTNRNFSISCLLYT